MKNWLITMGAVASLLALVACGGKGGGGDFVTSANDCVNYRYVQGMNGQAGYYVDAQNRQVQCNNAGNLNNGLFGSATQILDGNLYPNCSAYLAQGISAVPVQVQGYGVACMRTSTFQTILPNFQSLYSSYQTFPRYAMNCIPGVNCPSNCFGAQARAGNPLFFVGGTLALCFY